MLQLLFLRENPFITPLISIVAILAVVIGIIAFLFTNTLQDFYDGYYVDDVTVYDTLPSEAELEPLPIAEY